MGLARRADPDYVQDLRESLVKPRPAWSSRERLDQHERLGRLLVVEPDEPASTAGRHVDVDHVEAG
jgi:hypothetical protein